MRQMISVSLGLILATPAFAGVMTKSVTYEHGGAKCTGFLAWDDAKTGKRPGVLVIHEWWGLDEYAKKRAEQLAEMGYVAFACDMYGDGKLAKHPEDAMKFASEVRKSADTWRGRALAALKILANHEAVDASKLAAIGYCFGGSTCMQLAYGGADVKAVVSFHGGLQPPSPEQAKAIKSKVLICHGALDALIPEDTLQKVRKALDDAKVDYRMVYYGGALHSFTVPEADKAKMPTLAYQKAADLRSWQDMRNLFDEVFK
jgi:dienelactone hydrolase